MTNTAAETAKAVGQEIVSWRTLAIEKAGGTFVKIARELCSIAFSDIADYVTVAEGGELYAIPLQSIKAKKRRAIKKIKENTKITESKDGEKIWKDSHVEYELYDKMDALKYLCKLRGEEIDLKRITFDEATLNAILTGLPSGVGEAVRAELSRIVSGKRD
jgi:hypothetical protein